MERRMRAGRAEIVDERPRVFEGLRDRSYRLCTMGGIGDDTESGLPTGTVTFLLTDIESSTKLWETRPEAMERALRRHDSILAIAIEGHRGTLLKHKGEGDSAFAVFTTASDAVGTALAIQHALDAERWPDDLS